MTTKPPGCRPIESMPRWVCEILADAGIDLQVLAFIRSIHTT